MMVLVVWEHLDLDLQDCTGSAVAVVVVHMLEHLVAVAVVLFPHHMPEQVLEPLVVPMVLLLMMVVDSQQQILDLVEVVTEPAETLVK